MLLWHSSKGESFVHLMIKELAGKNFIAVPAKVLSFVQHTSTMMISNSSCSRSVIPFAADAQCHRGLHSSAADAQVQAHHVSTSFGRIIFKEVW